ncbi:hypothetical protein [Methanoregula sp.]|jgi:uncharacterized protein with HEPN domain|uniref:hypothetical protein n=1 Tax=Methanoregula sp. TaxID=2052170 RepID=UPI0035681671
MPGRNTIELLHRILAEITKVSKLIEGYQYEDFYRDEPTCAKVTASIRSIHEMAHQVPTIIQVKYAFMPSKELQALKEEVELADAVTRPRIIWKICTETLPRIQPFVENLIDEMEE